MDRILSIAASDVRVGDRIYNSHGYCESARWVPVTKVREEEGAPYPGAVNPRKIVVIETATYYTWKDPREGIAVKRDVPDPQENSHV